MTPHSVLRFAAVLALCAAGQDAPAQVSSPHWQVVWPAKAVLYGTQQVQTWERIGLDSGETSRATTAPAGGETLNAGEIWSSP